MHAKAVMALEMKMAKVQWSQEACAIRSRPTTR